MCVSGCLGEGVCVCVCSVLGEVLKGDEDVLNFQVHKSTLQK